jgi:hypothetical protein
LLQALVGPAILTRGNVGPAATAQPAFAEVAEIRITKQPGIIDLPLVVMEPNKLVEKHAKAPGLGDLKVSWVTLTSGGAATDALLSGSGSGDERRVEAALNEADQLIAREPAATARIYLDATGKSTRRRTSSI